MDRRFFVCAVAGVLSVGAASSGPSPADLLGASGDPSFIEWLDGFYARSLAAGWPRTLLDRELSGLSPDPRVAIQDARQPEFALPISQYLRGAITPGRIAEGQAKRNELIALTSIEQTYGVPRDILIAIWAMESGFGAILGDYDIIRALATLAAAGRRRAWAESELDAALRILADGEATRAQLKGSWAGAMGQTQLLPSAFLSTRPLGAGRATRNIWTSPQDALAASADLLAKGGWRRNESWAREVVAPAGFDWSLLEGPVETPGWWAGRGLHTADGHGWTDSDAREGAALIAPAGASGPAFLVLPNHFSIRHVQQLDRLRPRRRVARRPVRRRGAAANPMASRDGPLADRPVGRPDRPGAIGFQSRTGGRRHRRGRPPGLAGVAEEPRHGGRRLSIRRDGRSPESGGRRRSSASDTRLTNSRRRQSPLRFSPGSRSSERPNGPITHPPRPVLAHVAAPNGACYQARGLWPGAP